MSIFKRGSYILLNLGLYKIFEERGENTKALQYLEAYTKFRDALLDEEKVKKIAELELKYDAEKSEKDIRELKLQQSRFLIIGILVFFSCMSLLLTYILYSAKRQSSDRFRFVQSPPPYQFCMPLDDQHDQRRHHSRSIV